MGFGRLFGYGSFDKGMAAFLECVRALQVRLSASSSLLSFRFCCDVVQRRPLCCLLL